MKKKERIKVQFTTSIKAQRVIDIYAKILQGYTLRDTLAEYKDSGDTPTIIKRDFYKARRLMEENATEKISEMKAEFITKYNDLYKAAYSQKDWKECRGILDSLSKVTGVTKDIEIPTEFTIKWQ